MTHVTRRRFVALAAAGAVTPLGVARATTSAAPTAQEVVERLKARIGVPWRDEAGDTFHAGDPATKITGVVTTSMATLEVLQQAVQADANFVITAAPAFYAPGDRGGPGDANPLRTTPPDDPVLSATRAFIAQHGLVVFRLARHWHLRVPDPRAEGIAARMGWRGRPHSGDGLVYDVAPMTLETLAHELTERLGIRGGLRAIGDRQLTVRRIGLLPGVSRIEASIAMLPGVDAIVAGEVWEWESAAYVQDVVYGGLPKGFISIGRVVSEAPGMEVCADWLRGIAPDVPVRFITAGDPYWRPS